MPHSRSFEHFALARRRGLMFRIAMALFVAGVAMLFRPGPLPVIWLVMVAATQSLDCWAVGRFLGRPDEDIGDRERHVCAALMFVSAATFSILSLYLWAQPGLYPKLFGYLIPAGCLLNIAMTSKQAPGMMLVAWVPHLGCLLALPWLVPTGAGAASIGGAVSVTFGGLVYIGHMMLSTQRAAATADELTAALEAVSNERALLDAVIDLLPAVLLVNDANTGAFIKVNRAALDVLGVDPSLAVGRRAGDLMPAELSAAMTAGDQEAIASGQVQTGRETAVEAGGQTRYVKFSKAASFGPAGPKHLVTLIHDVTAERDAAEQLRAALGRAEAASQAKSAFLANMSHEIRTPLNGVLGMTHIMSRADLMPEQRAQLRVIQNSGELLMAVLNDVLDISKIEAGRLEIDRHPFDLQELVDSTCRPFAALASQKDLHFDVAVSSEAAGRWHGDGTRVRQVLSNLISNAVKFTAAGKVSVEVSAADGVVRCSVADSGPGIAPSVLPHLFQTFAQGDATTTRRFGGTGLGLAIARELVLLMGGDLTVDSREGEGATFVACIPMERLDPSLARVSDQAGGQQGPSLAGLRVLCAEDNATNQLIVRAMLEPLGVELHMASDGIEAVEAFERLQLDMVLMDIQMPQMDGSEATRRIRRLESAEQRPAVPIFAVTANAMTHQIKDYLATGFDGHVPKPITPEALMAAVYAAASARDAVALPLAASSAGV